MPTCENCGYKWTWKETFGRMFTFKPKLKCPSCKALQFITKKATQRISIIAVIPVLIWLPLLSLGVPDAIVFGTAGIIYLIVVVMMPFLMSLGNEEEPYW